MSQSMNGLSSISNAGLNEESNLSINNLSCNNVSCNNVSSNGILTDTLTVLQTNGTTANYTGVVNSNKYTGDKIQITDVSCNNLFSTSIQGIDVSCNNLFSTSIQSSDISCNKFNCDNITNIRENCGLLMTPTSVENILLGLSSGNSLTNGCNYNIAIGHQCYDSQVVSNSNGNIAVGFKAGLNMSGGSNNIYLGNLTGELETDTNVYNNSCCIGNNSFISASNTIFLGTASESVVVRGDLLCNGDISFNSIVCSGIGCNSLSLNNSEITSTMIDNLSNLSSNVQNSLDRISKDSGLAITTGLGNVSLGIFSLPNCSTGNYNVAIGQDSLLGITVGNNNIGIGKFSGFGINQSAENCICIGTQSGQGTDDATVLISNSIAIGNQAKFNKSNQISIGTEFHTVKIAGKVECDDIINKGKIKYGRNAAGVNGLTTVFFPTPFPLGTLPMIQLTPIFPVNIPNSGFLFVYDYDNTNFRYAYYKDNVHNEISILVNWMAMIP